jgi:hypothetical protein
MRGMQGLKRPTPPSLDGIQDAEAWQALLESCGKCLTLQALSVKGCGIGGLGGCRHRLGAPAIGWVVCRTASHDCKAYHSMGVRTRAWAFCITRASVASQPGASSVAAAPGPSMALVQ